MKRLTVLLLAAGFATTSQAQDKSKGFVKMGGGMEYNLVMDAPGNQHPEFGDYIEMHLSTYVDDSLIFSTRNAMNNEPAPLQIQKPPFKGDLMYAIREFTPGDSAVVRISIDSILAFGSPKAPWMKRGVGQTIDYHVNLVSVKSMEQKKKEDEAHAVKQQKIDEQIIKDYLAKNNVKAKRTEDGLYYVIEREGNGVTPNEGEKVIVNYTGKLTNGTVFDSNVDPAFHHVQPFEFLLGRGMVIRGWDEGFKQLSKGAKATLFIPSGMAYGPNSPDPKIPANSVMIFEVELVDIEDPNAAQQPAQESIQQGEKVQQGQKG